MTGYRTSYFLIALAKLYDEKQPAEECLFQLVIPESASVMQGSHSSKWVEQETGRSNLRPQTQSKESKVEVWQSHELRKPTPSDIPSKQHCQLGDQVFKYQSLRTFLVQTTSDVLFLVLFCCFFFFFTKLSEHSFLC